MDFSVGLSDGHRSMHMSVRTVGFIFPDQLPALRFPPKGLWSSGPVQVTSRTNAQNIFDDCCELTRSLSDALLNVRG